MKKHVWKRLDAAQRLELLKRPQAQACGAVEETVRALLSQIEREGDAAVRSIVARLDGYDPDPVCVDKREIESSEAFLPEALRRALEVAYFNLRAYHERQGYRPFEVETMDGVFCARRVVPLQSVGVYVPGGTAPLISTALMTCVPAQLAGCPEIILCTPGREGGKVDPGILYVAKLCGVSSVARIGGVPAIGALAFGTQSVPKVDKIFGPGNMYVTEAKVQVSKKAGGPAMDLPAGPSEVLVIVDERTPPAVAAADLLAQAEHDKVSQVVLVSTDGEKVDAILRELDSQVKALPRREIAEAAMEQSVALVVETKEEAVGISNLYAPEHLILLFEDAEKYLDSVRNAGSVFCGLTMPESFGDYASGTNHVLPNAGAARAYSGLTVEAFQKTISVQKASLKGFEALAGTVITLAEAEGLDAHANAVKIRRTVLQGE